MPLPLLHTQLQPTLTSSQGHHREVGLSATLTATTHTGPTDLQAPTPLPGSCTLHTHCTPRDNLASVGPGGGGVGWGLAVPAQGGLGEKEPLVSLTKAWAQGLTRA